MTTELTPAPRIAAACDRRFPLPAVGLRLATGGTIRLPGGATLLHPAGGAAPLSGAPPAPLGPSPCHEPSNQGWCAYCEPRAVLARMQAAFPFPIQVAGRVVG
jgi:hypothetical protein